MRGARARELAHQLLATLSGDTLQGAPSGYTECDRGATADAYYYSSSLPLPQLGQLRFEV